MARWAGNEQIGSGKVAGSLAVMPAEFETSSWNGSPGVGPCGGYLTSTCLCHCWAVTQFTYGSSSPLEGPWILLTPLHTVENTEK